MSKNGYHFRNHDAIESIIDAAVAAVQTIDQCDFDFSRKIDAHEAEVLFAIINARAELDRLIHVARQIRRANRS